METTRVDGVRTVRNAVVSRRYVVKNIPMEMVVAGADSASELELWEDGVLVVSRHRDAVDVTVGESTRPARECRDGVVPAGATRSPRPCARSKRSS